MNLLATPPVPRSWWPLGLIIGAVLLVVLLDYRPLHDPIAKDASLFSVNARVEVGEMTHHRVDPQSGAGMWHSSLYQVLLNSLARTVGSELIFARLMGLGLGLLTALLAGGLVILIKRHKSSRWWLAAFAIAAYLTNPFGRLGMLHLDNDTSVMPPILLTLAGVAILLSRRFKLGSLVFLAGLQALAFWAKLGTSLLAPLGLAYRLRLDRKNWSILWIPATVLLGGGTLLALGWAAYRSTMGYPFQWEFMPTAGLFVERSTAGEGMAYLIRHLIGLVYWFNPAFLILWIASSWKLLARQYNGRETRDLKLLALFSWGIMVGYVVVGGIPDTLPGHLYPAVPLISILVAFMAVPHMKFSRLTLIIWSAAIPALAGYYYVLGDPLYRWFYGIRAYAWNEARSPALPTVYLLILFKDLLLVLLPVFVAVAIAFVERREKRLARLVPWLVLIGIGYNLGLGLRQSLAPYATTSNYGMQDADRVLECIRDGAEVLIYEGALLGPNDNKRLYYTVLDAHGGEEAIIEALRTTRADYLIVGLSINTLSQLFALERSPDLSLALQSRFLERRIGDFILYDRLPRPR